jgi:FlaA1/EpsC-like NDP-sugar epimerase
MITASDSYNTYDLGKYYVIIPTVPNWNVEEFKSSFNAKKVENGFNYSSGENTEWETVESLRMLINEYINFGLS